MELITLNKKQGYNSYNLVIESSVFSRLKLIIENEKDQQKKMSINSLINNLIIKEVEQYFLNKERIDDIKEIVQNTEDQLKQDAPDDKQRTYYKGPTTKDHIRTDNAGPVTSNAASQKKTLKKEQIKKLDINTLLDLL